MKKNILCILITIILFIVCSIQEIVNATNQNKNDFFTSNKTILVEDIQSENNAIKNNDSNMNNSQNSDKITQSIQYNGSDNNYLKSLTITWLLNIKK